MGFLAYKGGAGVVSDGGLGWSVRRVLEGVQRIR